MDAEKLSPKDVEKLIEKLRAWTLVDEEKKLIAAILKRYKEDKEKGKR